MIYLLFDVDILSGFKFPRLIAEKYNSIGAASYEYGPEIMCGILSLSRAKAVSLDMWYEAPSS